MTLTERAILAGGCFWGMQDLIRRYPGVVSTRVGYTGGDVPNATYRNHGTHAESIEIIFDPATISYREILEFFFQIHDPTTRNRQGNDVGTSYRSAIFYTSDEQKRIAEDTIADVIASGLWPGKVVTEVAPAGDFWEAEPEHQDYLERIPDWLHLPFRPAELEAPGPRKQRPAAIKHDGLTSGAWSWCRTGSLVGRCPLISRIAFRLANTWSRVSRFLRPAPPRESRLVTGPSAGNTQLCANSRGP